MNELQQRITEILQAHHCRLYDLEWQTDKKPPVLQVAAEKDDGTMDLDTCAELSEAISQSLDEINWGGEHEYMLEVCSPGAERELKTEEQIAAALDKYVYVKLKNPVKGMEDVLGYLKELTPETMTIAYNDKGRPRKAVLDRENVALVMTAVKL